MNSQTPSYNSKEKLENNDSIKHHLYRLEEILHTVSSKIKEESGEAMSDANAAFIYLYRETQKKPNTLKGQVIFLRDPQDRIVGGCYLEESNKIRCYSKKPHGSYEVKYPNYLKNIQDAIENVSDAILPGYDNLKPSRLYARINLNSESTGDPKIRVFPFEKYLIMIQYNNDRATIYLFMKSS